MLFDFGRGALAAGLLAFGAAWPPPAAARHFEGTAIERPEAIRPFFNRLLALETGDPGPVSILHVGDSHIQGEQLTGPLRRLFQARFGSAGRGLVVPFQAAGLSGAWDVMSVSNITWENVSVVSQNGAVPPGVAGTTVWTKDGGFIIKIGFIDSVEPDDTFDRVTILAEAGSDFAAIRAASCEDPLILEKARPAIIRRHHKIKPGESLWGIGRKYGCTVEDLKRWNGLGSDLIITGRKLEIRKKGGKKAPVNHSEFKTLGVFQPEIYSGPYRASLDLPGPARSIFLMADGKTGKGARIYGIILARKKEAGLFYETCGVNGAQYRHFNQAWLFWRQLGLIRPDLVIVSLGTNDSLVAGFDREIFLGEVEKFIGGVRGNLGEVPVLLTSPPDRCGLRGRNDEAELAVRKALAEIAKRHGISFWDAHAFMGGEGSIGSWKRKGLAKPDQVHLTPEGYRLMAQGLFEAMLAAAEGERENHD